MGPFGAQGINGTSVGTISTGDGSPQTLEFTIPEGLRGSNRIAIRAQTAHAAPYLAYNWFFNATTP
jgi:hypothetical protein